MERPDPTAASRWNRRLGRRDVLRLGAVIAAGGVRRAIARRVCRRASANSSAPSRCFCAPSPSSPEAAIRAREPALKQGLRRLQGAEPRHRVGHPGAPGRRPRMGPAGACRDGVRRAGRARDASMACSSEPGRATACWRTSAPIRGWPTCSPECQRSSISAGLGESATRAVPLAVTRGVHTTGMYYNKALLDRAGLEPPKTIADLKAMVEPLGRARRCAARPCSGDVALQPAARHVGAADDRRAHGRPAGIRREHDQRRRRLRQP